MNLVDLVRKEIVARRMIEPGETVLAACSGGCDSMALTHILACLREDLGFELAAANINHMLREEAKSEAALVAEFCAFLKIPYYHQTIDVPFFIKKEGLSLQEAARNKRYEYLRSVAQKLNDAKIATGHHLDDQAETVLINLLRGAGSSGLGGIKPFYNRIIRPLLSINRIDLENYCAANNISFCNDLSNFKTDYLRNAIRLNLLPQLAREYNSGIKEVLAKTAAITAAENDFMEKTAVAQWADVVSANGKEELFLNIKQFNKLHLAVKRALLRKIIAAKLQKLTGISFTHVESLIKLAMAGEVGSLLTLPHFLKAQKTYDYIIFTKKENLPPVACSAKPLLAPQTLTTGETTRLPDLGLTVSLKLSLSCPDLQAVEKGKTTAVFDYEQLHAPLSIRTRLPGDYFAPSGSSGGKKLKEFFIDKKVPQKERDFIPLIVDQKGIIWVIGHRLSNRAQITANTTKFLQIMISSVDTN